MDGCSAYVVFFFGFSIHTVTKSVLIHRLTERNSVARGRESFALAVISMDAAPSAILQSFECEFSKTINEHLTLKE